MVFKEVTNVVRSFQDEIERKRNAFFNIKKYFFHFDA